MNGLESTSGAGPTLSSRASRLRRTRKCYDRPMSDDALPVIFTLGHSTHPIERFVDLLREHGIERVVDARGQPYSRFNPQYNRERLNEALKAAGIAYEWRGDRLSGRPKELQFYGPDGKVLWDRLRAWPALHQSLDEVAATAAGTPTVLVCAEEDPRGCHRRFLLTPPMVERGFEVRHLRGDGTVEPEAAVARASGENPDQLDLFS